MSEFHFHSISWERIDGIWPDFASALILTRSRLGMLRVSFCKFIRELWPLIDVKISFPLNILRQQVNGIWPKFAYALGILTRSRLELLRVSFHKLITQLQPLIDVRILFPVNILRTNCLRTNWWNLTNFFMCIYIGKIQDGIITSLFLQICNRVMSLDWCQNFCFHSVSWEILDHYGFWPNCAYALILTTSKLGLINIAWQI